MIHGRKCLSSGSSERERERSADGTSGRLLALRLGGGWFEGGSVFGCSCTLRHCLSVCLSVSDCL